MLNDGYENAYNSTLKIVFILTYGNIAASHGISNVLHACNSMLKIFDLSFFVAGET